MTDNEIDTLDELVEIEHNLDEIAIPSAVERLNPEARELLAEMAQETRRRMVFILNCLKR
jgi:hypothetical protein